MEGAGYEVFAVNPTTDEVEGDRCYPALADIPDGVDAVVISTNPNVAPDLVRQCAAEASQPSSVPGLSHSITAARPSDSGSPFR